MGRRGPPKKPAAIHERQGTFRPDRHAGGLVPGSIPEKPPQLSERAGAEWDRLAAQMAAAGLLNDRFLMAFAAYCECVAEYWHHKKTIADEDYTATTIKGNVIQHPAVGMMGKCLDRMVKLERELGLTPASATGLSPGSAEEEDPLERLTRERGAQSAPTPQLRHSPPARATKRTSRRTSKAS